MFKIAGIEEKSWRMHKRYARVTYLRYWEGFVKTFQRTIRLFLRMAFKIWRDRKHELSCVDQVVQNQQNLFPNDLVDISEDCCQLSFGWILAGLELTALNRKIEDRMDAFLPRRSWASFTEVATAMKFLFSSCSNPQIDFLAKVLCVLTGHSRETVGKKMREAHVKGR